MNKLVLVLATAATFGFGTAAFAASPSTASTQERVQPAQSQATGAHKMKARHRADGGPFRRAPAHRCPEYSHAGAARIDDGSPCPYS